jgi:transcriptional antiterminator
MLRQKIELLFEAKQISNENFIYLQKTLEKIELIPISLEDEKVHVLVTHLAMAIARQEKGESMQEMDAAIFTDIAAQEAFPRAKKLWEKLQDDIPVTFSEAETQYMLLHLCQVA